MRALVVGTSHRRAPVEVRERLAFRAEEGGALAARLAADGGEAAALSTCNRTELYLVAEDADAAEVRARAELAGLSGLPEDELATALYVHSDGDGARHLLRVAAGLDSMVPGEPQILGQVREAYEAATKAGAVGPVLHRLFRHALRAGKRVRAETALGDGGRSIATAAADLAERSLGDLSSRSVLLLGAGKMAELVAHALRARGAERFVVANRSRESALRLASRLGGEAAPLEDLVESLADADVVVASTSSREIVVGADAVERALARRPARPLFLVDIAVPRDVDPAARGLTGCFLYDVDALEEGMAGEAASRRGELQRAEAIVDEEAEAFGAWLQTLEVVPAIASLRALAEDIRAAELERAEAQLGSLSPAERRAVESVTAQIVGKLLHAPTVRLKEAAAAGDGAEYAEAVRHLFGIDAPSARLEGK